MSDMVISATVVTKDQAQATRAMEAFGRAAAGLGLEGLSVNVHIGTVEDDEGVG